MIISQETSRKLSILSLIASVLIVFLHAPATNTRGVSMMVECFVGGHLATIAVPFFFVVSGYLLGAHYQQGSTYACELYKRVKSLLVPYLIWCVILGLSGWATTFWANVVNHQPLMRYIHISLVDLFGLNLQINPPRPLWYMRALMFFVIMSPAIMVMIRRGRYVAYGFMVLLWLVGLFIETRMPVSWSTLFDFTLAPTSTISFFLGMTLSHFPIPISRKKGGSLFVFGIIIMIVDWLGQYNMRIDVVVHYLLRHFAILLVLVGGWSVCPAVELPMCLRNQAFPIYLLHGLLHSVWLVLKTLAPSIVLSWPGYLVGGCLMTLGSIVISILLRRLCPKMASIAFGGRT